LLGDRRREHCSRGRVARRDAPWQFRIPEERLVACDPKVAKKRQREATGDRRTVDGRDYGAAALTDGLECEGAGLDQALAVAEIPPELARIHTGAEGRARAGEDDAADLLVAR